MKNNSQTDVARNRDPARNHRAVFRQLSARALHKLPGCRLFSSQAFSSNTQRCRAEGAQQAAAAGTHREHHFPSGRG